jgi:hypothetical protein
MQTILYYLSGGYRLSCHYFLPFPRAELFYIDVLFLDFSFLCDLVTCFFSPYCNATYVHTHTTQLTGILTKLYPALQPRIADCGATIILVDLRIGQFVSAFRKQSISFQA